MPLKQQLNKILPFFPVILFVFNIAAKALYLTSQEIALDEPFSIYHAQFNVSTIIEQMKGYNNPPLFEIVLHFWTRLFGISPVAVRSLPLLFAALSPVVLFYFGKRFFSLRAGILSSILLSVSTLVVYYAHDCRVYTLFLLLSILSMYFFMALVAEKLSNIKTVVCFILMGALLIYSHYFGLFVLFFQGICLLFFYRHYLLKFTACYAIMLLLYLPHIYTLLTRMGHSVSRGTWLEAPDGISSLYYMLWEFSNSPVVTVACIILLVAALSKSIINKKYRDIDAKSMLVLAWFLFAFFGMFFISSWVPMYISRYLIFALPAYYILLVLCIDHLFIKPVVNNAITFGFVLLFGLTINLNPDKKQTVGKGVQVIKQYKTPDALVIISPADFLPSFAYNYNQKYFSETSDNNEYHLTNSLLRSENIYFVNNATDLDQLDLQQFKSIIYYGVGEAFNEPANSVLKALNINYVQQQRLDLGRSNAVSFFVKK